MEGESSQAAPMLCIRKPDGRLRTVVDCRARNANTKRAVTLFPDQDTIIDDMARAKFMSKIDLADAYEQVLVAKEHIKHTVTPKSVWMF